MAEEQSGLTVEPPYGRLPRAPACGRKPAGS